jgi:hypothetical protein
MAEPIKQDEFTDPRTQRLDSNDEFRCQQVFPKVQYKYPLTVTRSIASVG